MRMLLATGAESPQGYHEKAMRLWQQLKQEGKVDRRKTYHARIGHDDWCVIFKGQPRCTCDPDITMIPHDDPGCPYCTIQFGDPEALSI